MSVQSDEDDEYLAVVEGQRDEAMAEVKRLKALHVTEWAVLSDDGVTYEVEGKARARAHYEAANLRIPNPKEDGYCEPTARVVERHICPWAGTWFHEPDAKAEEPTP